MTTSKTIIGTRYTNEYWILRRQIVQLLGIPWNTLLWLPPLASTLRCLRSLGLTQHSDNAGWASIVARLTRELEDEDEC